MITFGVIDVRDKTRKTSSIPAFGLNTARL